MVLDLGLDAVLRQQFAERAVLALGAGAVVAPDIEDQGVLALAHLVQGIEEPSGLRIGMLGIAGKDLHQAKLEGALVLGNIRPARQTRGTRGQFGIFGDPADLFLPREDILAHLVPAGVELAVILVGPFLEDVMRAMRRTGGPVDKEGTVRRQGMHLLHP
ncbi:hypothetical protein D3C76_1278980 [compost metagenome]